MRRLLIGVLVLVATVTGCSAGPGPRRATVDQTLGTIQQAVGEASSAVATAETVLSLWQRDDLAAVTADAAAADAAYAVAAAAHDLTVVVVPDASTLALRDEALAAVQEATVAVAGSRTWIAGRLDDTAGERIARRLGENAGRLEDVAKAVAEARTGGR